MIYLSILLMCCFVFIFDLLFFHYVMYFQGSSLPDSFSVLLPLPMDSGTRILATDQRLLVRCPRGH